VTKEKRTVGRPSLPPDAPEQISIGLRIEADLVRRIDEWGRRNGAPGFIHKRSTAIRALLLKALGKEADSA
jgi:uncharacterized protein (DUF4415 family)